MMQLKAQFSDINDVPEQFRELYSETSPGKWTLTAIDGLRTEQEFEQACGSLKNELAATEKLKSVCEKLGLSPDDLEKLNAEYSDLKTKFESTDAKYKKNVIESALRDAALKFSVRPEALPDLLARAAVFQIDDTQQVRTLPGHGGLPVDEWLAKQLKDSPHWLAPSRSGGAKQTPFFRMSGVKSATMAEIVSESWKAISNH